MPTGGGFLFFLKAAMGDQLHGFDEPEAEAQSAQLNT